MEKKYRLTEETKTAYGVELHRIEALRDFGNVKAGDKGGWVQSGVRALRVCGCFPGRETYYKQIPTVF